MEIVLFILYLSACIFLIARTSFFENSGLHRWVLPSLFLVKILAGIAYALFYRLPQYYEGSDTWRFYRLSLEETAWLKRDPLAFLKDLFVHGYEQSGNVFSGHNSYWNDLKSNLVVKMIAVMNPITGSSYYVNLILFNLLFFIGLVAFYRTVSSMFNTRHWGVVAIVFLLPSTLFWCSGIHKDGLLLSAAGLIFFLFHRCLTSRFTITRSVAIVFLLIFLFALRNYFALALLPALLCWGLTHRFPSYKWRIWLGIYATGIIIFFVAPSIVPAADFPAHIVMKQQEFRQLQGGSAVAVQQLSPTPGSFLQFLPEALKMAFLRPLPGEVKNLSYIPAVLETAAFICLLLFCMFKMRQFHLPPAAICVIFFGISLLIIAGYTITFSGAIVRYRSTALPFIAAPMLAAVLRSKNI